MKARITRPLVASLVALLLIPAAAAALPRTDGAVPRSHENQAIRHAESLQPESTVSVVRTIDHPGGDTTLAVVLAATALGIALTGAGYVAFRVRPMLHSS